MLGQMSGLRMVENPYAQVEDGKRGTYVKRSVKERLFSLPWTPLRKNKLVLIQNYKPIMYRMGDAIIFHPSMKSALENLSRNAV